ncbi:MAG: sugar-phosphatase [Streptococcaceae bacterium]|jgi:Cof subfamily protein (haloacid dehalogenase superfamily)|nr:sugar-phosphatase [Streptococcaceae bacterium]
MIKLVALDLDGTTLDPERKLTPEVIEAIGKAKAAGVKIVICTGRPLPGVIDILDQLNLRQHGDFVVTYNGALVQRADTGEEFISQGITSDEFLDIDNAARKAGLHIHALTRDGVYTTNRDIGKYSVQEAFLVNMPLYYRTAEEIQKLDLLKVMMIDEEEILNEGIAYLPFELFGNFNLIKSAPYFLEILNKNVSKGNAIKLLSKKLYLDLDDEVMTIGDEENDRSMLEAVGHSVAMGNATEAIKKTARYITKTNAESGVAWAINQWVLPDYR